MYDLPEMRLATDTLWMSLATNMHRAGLKNVPIELQHDQPVRDLWNDPDLFVSQCCGYDVIDRYKDLLQPVATPEFSAFGCRDENYCSVIVVTKDCRFNDVRDMAGARAVINGPESHSGMSTLRHLVAPRHSNGRFFSEVLTSGSHVASLDLLRAGKAEVAAIDSVTLTLLRQSRKGVFAGLKILGTSYRAPAPPYVVKASMPDGDVDKIRQAFSETFADPALADCRAELRLSGISLSRQEDYWVHEAFKDHAQRQGFPTLQ